MTELENAITKDFTLDHAYNTLDAILKESKEVEPKNDIDHNKLVYLRKQLYRALIRINNARTELRK